MVSFEHAVAYLAANPNLLYAVLMIGFYSLLFELTHPITGVFGIVSVCLLTLAFFSFIRLPINPVGPCGMALGIAFFLGEAFFPRYGFLAAVGIVMMVAGSALLFSATSLRIDYVLIIPLTLLTAGITIFLVRAAIRAYKAKVVSGKEGMIGLQGSVEADILPKKPGKVFLQGTLWNAVADEEIKKGEKAEIVSIDSMTLKVRKVS